MAKGSATLRGRFSPGTVVRLVEVDDGSVLRAEGGREIDRKKVDKDGTVSFKSGVEDGGHYFIVGQQNGFPLEVRIRGNADEDGGALPQAPVQGDRVKLSDGSFLDEPPEQHQKAGTADTFPGQHEVPRGQWQRSDTPRGAAHPHDPEEPTPYPAQGDHLGKVVQRSSTEQGLATPIEQDSPASQSDVKSNQWQRSSTELGYATPIPRENRVKAQEKREASRAKTGAGDHEPTFATKDPVRDPAVVLAAFVEKEDGPPAAPPIEDLAPPVGDPDDTDKKEKK